MNLESDFLGLNLYHHLANMQSNYFPFLLSKHEAVILGLPQRALVRSQRVKVQKMLPEYLAHNKRPLSTCCEDYLVIKVAASAFVFIILPDM